MAPVPEDNAALRGPGPDEGAPRGVRGSLVGGSLHLPLTPVGADQKLSSSKEVTDFDGKGGRFIGTGNLGSGSGEEGQDPLFVVKAGGSLKNVILGAPAADGAAAPSAPTGKPEAASKKPAEAAKHAEPKTHGK